MPGSEDIDFILPGDRDPFASIFRNEETGTSWSLNDLWHELQGAVDPFEGIEKGQRPVLRTACFPYPQTSLHRPRWPDSVGQPKLLRFIEF